MEAPEAAVAAGDYPESAGEEEAYPCKGCGEILEEGKAFELANNRWHLDCFRCNQCHTLLDSDANLLLLGDGSLICNNCTYSCSACGNKIEDLAILTGDQAFCATCFRCRNCKRKIENLRYARTSQGIFCMSCHESLMARRRKKSKLAAAQAKAKEKDSMLVDKSLPALPPLPPSEKAATEAAQSREPAMNPHTELSPRPRPQYPDEVSRSSLRRAESPSDMGHRDGLTLPTTTYRNNRHSHASDMTADGDGFFIPLAFDSSPAPTPRLAQNTKTERSMKENAAAKDMLSPSARSARGQVPMSQSTPHIAFQEKGRTTSTEYSESSKDGGATTRRPPPRPSAGSRSTSATASPALGGEEPKRQHFANSMSNGNANEKAQSPQDKFKLQDVPKRRRSHESRNSAKTEAVENPQARPLVKRENLSRTESAESTRVSQERPRGGVNQYPAAEPESRPSADWAMSPPPARETRAELPTASKPMPRKEVGGGKLAKTQPQSYAASDTMSSSVSSTDSTALPTPTVNGKPISSPVIKPSEESAPRLPIRSAPPHQKPSDTYMAPRAPPIPPPPFQHKSSKQAINPLTGEPISPKLPRWSAGGDFTMDEDMARILGTDERAESLLRRVSNAVRHGRSISETTSRTVTSGHWPKTPIAEDGVASPQSISMGSPRTEDSAVLRRQLRNSEQRVAELERVFVASGELKSVTKQLVEKRKTVHELGSQAEIMIRQIEVLAGYVERAKRAEGKQELNMEEMEESAIKDFVLRIERLKQSMSRQVETLFEERETLLDEKAAAIKSRDRALAEFEQLSLKNAQLADLNNDLTTQIQERFRAQSGPAASVESPKPPMSSGGASTNGLGIYVHSKDKLSLATLDDAPSTTAAATAYAPSLATAHSFPHVLDADAALEPATVLSAPHVVNIRKAQAKKFNWKKGGATVAKGVSKGFKGAFGSERERNAAAAGGGGEIGMPYNTTVTPVDSPSLMALPQNSQLGGGGGSLPKSQSSDPRGFGLFKKSHANSKSAGGASALNPAAESPATLFGSDLVERAAFERRHIPSVVIRCIEEVELRGMDVEGIYRKTGGSGLVRMIQEGFEKETPGMEIDISDPDVDITAVTSVLKQYFRKLPVPLLTFDVYERVLEALTIPDSDPTSRCAHLRHTFSLLPPIHRDVLEFLIFHLARVVSKASVNLMTPKNVAVVFAPTIMRDRSVEREMSDVARRNEVVQFVVENSEEIFGGE
ncbi:Rho-type gtpase-activating protein [Pseudogymnoascus destructans]|uniref:Rho-type gtpase-activating protein n=2 Tax=Pseudogymnoascus destructans TaxID=655981 RepID=L8GB34_PSED2|nr:Rho-type gtpase-activating protein [Pseudogymnoascus destructans]ELR09236.1 hypothetical protein GMDG_03809 [Pseudogymnoascus destructans 20631-21]OAF61320.1 Rho-type gtpase-activating protein [Pseudogymnoascus destructans]